MRPGCYSMQSALLGLILWTIASPAIAAERNHSIGVTVPQADLSVGFTLQAPADVNVEPFCTDLSLPCTSPRTFPDLGLAVSGAAYVHRRVALVGEASVFDNLWYSSATKEGRQDNYVRLLLVGVRGRVIPPAVGGRKATGVRIFGQLLAGTEWSSVFGGRRAIQPGGGIRRQNQGCVRRAGAAGLHVRPWRVAQSVRVSSVGWVGVWFRIT